MPFTPYLASECLLNLNCKDVNKWPKINEKALNTDMINMVIQVNGKTRDVINIKKNLTEAEIKKLIINFPKANKYITNKKVAKTIFVKNKIINYILAN